MSDPQKGNPHQAEDDITPLMLTVGALLLASMVIGYFIAM